VAEYRVEVRQNRSMAEVALRIEPTPGCGNPTALAADVGGALENAFALRIPVTTVACGTLPQFEMKAKRWVTVEPG
jgi:phenylacetate-coenzyme A ligase PaaK-like adenylate-forming protein